MTAATRTRPLSPGVQAKLARLGYRPEHVGRARNARTYGRPRNAAPTTPDELAATIYEKAKGGKNSITPEWLDETARAYAAANGDVATQVRDETQRVLAEWLRDGAGTPVNLTPGSSSARNALYSRSAPGTAADGIFDNIGEFFAGISPGADKYDQQLQAKLAKVKNAISPSQGTTTPSEGGFLVPEAMRSELLFMSLETSIVRPRATVIPMGTQRVPIPSIDDTSHASSVFGGIVAFWTEESATLTPTAASFGRTVLDAKKLTVYLEAPNELVADAPAFGAFLNRALPQATSFYEDKAFLGGTGVGEPLGVLNAPAKIEVPRAVVDLIDFPDVVNMFSRMLPSSLNRAVWVASIDTLPQLLTLHAEPVAGQPVSPMLWLNNGSVAGAPAMSLLGRPVIFTENVPKLTEIGALSFIDFGYYLIGDRQAAEARSSEHLRFNEDRTAYRIIERVDGRPWLSTAITPANGSVTLSPFVTIAT